MSDYETPPSPIQFHFTYFEYTTKVNVTELVPSAGGKHVPTLVTVRGNGFADHGGIFCSFPGAQWDEMMSDRELDYPWRSFTTRATLIDASTLHCLVPPQGNNTSPVFLEVCIGGHPDEVKLRSQKRRLVVELAIPARLGRKALG